MSSGAPPLGWAADVTEAAILHIACRMHKVGISMKLEASASSFSCRISRCHMATLAAQRLMATSNGQITGQDLRRTLHGGADMSDMIAVDGLVHVEARPVVVASIEGSAAGRGRADEAAQASRVHAGPSSGSRQSTHKHRKAFENPITYSPGQLTRRRCGSLQYHYDIKNGTRRHSRMGGDIATALEGQHRQASSAGNPGGSFTAHVTPNLLIAFWPGPHA